MIEFHHALLYRADSIEYVPLNLTELRERAEVFELHNESLSIDDVRMLQERAHRLPLEKDLQLLLIVTNKIAIEAQHALLKILEDPPVTTKFILVVKPGSYLLPTVLSRCHQMQVDKNQQELQPQTDDFFHFLSLSLSDRIALVAEKNKKKDDKWFQWMLTGLCAWMSTQSVDIQSKYYIYTVFLQQRGAAKKMVWEALALSLPMAS